MKTILIADDDNAIRRTLELHLNEEGYAVRTAADCHDAIAKAGHHDVDLMLLDLRLPGLDGFEVLKIVKERRPELPVIMITAYDDMATAIEAIRLGAVDHLGKPVDLDHLDEVIEKVFEMSLLAREGVIFRDAYDARFEQNIMVGRSRSMKEIYKTIGAVADSRATVLIQGESGTGKELVARALHNESPRSSAPLIKVNCAATPENLIESEFFGHEKGAFTGALNKREGRFELAHGGTILLDEISEISPGVQAKLLRVLQEREFERVGGNRTIKVDVRVIATTNRRLEQSVQRKEFREDLFFRLNVVPIRVPSLRERREDILFLAEHFLSWYARKHGCAARRFSDDCEATLLGHHWPGNVRELQNVIERAVIMTGDSPVVESAHFCLAGQPLEPPATAAGSDVVGRVPSPGGGSDRPVVSAAGESGEFPPLHELEKRHIFAALERCHNNRTQAAKVLDISVRTLRNKLNEYHGHTEPSGSGPTGSSEPDLGGDSDGEPMEEASAAGKPA